MNELIDKALALCEAIERQQAELRDIVEQLRAMSQSEPQAQEAEAEIKTADIEAPVGAPIEVYAEAPMATAAPTKPRNDIRKAFTINDRYRFRRELFAGDDAAMTSVIDKLATFDTLEEADSYLSTMPWDGDSDVISEFMTIVSNHFNGYYQ